MSSFPTRICEKNGGGGGFKTKGAHSKTYYPWGFPGLGNEVLEGSLLDGIVKGIAGRIGSQLIKDDRVKERVRGDSTSASSLGTRTKCIGGEQGGGAGLWSGSGFSMDELKSINRN